MEREKGAFDCPDNVVRYARMYEGRTKGAAMSTQSYQMSRCLEEEEEERSARIIRKKSGLLQVIHSDTSSSHPP